jgi:hypothetical protein
MISGLVLKYLNGERFVICGFYKFTLPVSTSFCLTVPLDVIVREERGLFLKGAAPGGA